MIQFCPSQDDIFHNDITACIANVTTKYRTLRIGEHIFPVTINNKEYSSSYVCSPYTACISYCKEEMHKLGNKPLEFTLATVLSPISILLKAIRVNKVVSVNNYLLSTNLYPNWHGEYLQEATKYLLAEYPQHAIMFRSLNYKTNAELLRHFQQQGYILFPSRQVYIFDHQQHDYFKHQNTKRDFKLLDTTSYKVIKNDEITAQDYARIVELYNLLYLEKYSYYNPQFTEKCIEFWHRNGFLHIQALKDQDANINGVVGYFEKNGVITAPLVGYDTKRPQKEGLYRLLMALVIRRAHETEQILNLSSGASSFKILRGGQPHIEYSAIYIRHLPLLHRMVWKTMQILFQGIGVPLLKKYQL